MLKSGLCYYSVVYILIKGTITIAGKEAKQAARQTDERDQEVKFKTLTLFTDCISEINNTQK